MSILNELRRIADSPPLRPVLLRPAVRRLGAALLGLRFLAAAWEMDRPWMFLWSEGTRLPLAQYRVRGSDVRVVVRHDSGARELVHEIFSQRCYEPSEAISAKLPESPAILDIGANVGGFAAFALSRWPNARLTCIEPDPENLRALSTFVRANPRCEVAVIAACATTSEGVVGFAAGQGSGSRIADGFPLTPAVDVMPLIRAADFVKCDIEGGEWPILTDHRLAGVGPTLLVMEYHRRFPGDRNAASEAQRCLKRAGFTVIKVMPNHWGHGIIWAQRF